MRNLKKVLSLALALVMLLGMMVVGAGAATSFKDDADIKNQEAVAVLVGMGIMKGREDGSNFEPAGTLTRAEAAMMIAQMDLGVDAAAALVANGTNTFSDVWSGYWAGGAIDYCVEQGYITGDGAGHFFPGRNVSSVEFGIMLLRLLGYDAKIEGLVGNEWAAKGAALARKAGLTTGVVANTQPMTRDDMAQMSFNALTAALVEYEGMDITIGDVAINARVKIRTHTGSTTSGMGNTTYNNERIQANITPIRLCEEKFPNLKLYSRGAADAFGRTYSVWRWKNVDISGSRTLVAADFEWHEYKSSVSLNGATGDSSTLVYVDGKPEDITGKTINAAYVAGKTENGRLVQVFLNPNDHTDIDKIVVVNTYVGRVSSVNSAKETISVAAAPSAKNPGTLNGTFETTDFNSREVVLYTAAWNASSKKYDVETVDHLGEPTTGTLTKWVGSTVESSTGKAESNFTVDSNDPYKYNVNAYVVDDADSYLEGVWKFTVNKSEINVYTDQYGYAIYVSGVEGTKNYAAVIGTGSTNPYGDETTGVTLLLADGTRKSVTATLTASSARLVDDQGTVGGSHGAQLVTDLIGDLVTYVENDNGTYTLTVADNWDTSNVTDNAKTKFTNGRSALVLNNNTYYTTSKTLFFVATGTNPNITYNVYTGYDAMPSFKTTGVIDGFAVKTNARNNQVEAVYIGAGELDDAIAADTYFVKAKDADIYTDNTGSYYILPAVVDGEVTEIKLSVNASGTDGSDWTDNANVEGLFAIKGVRKDKNDIITSYTDAKTTVFGTQYNGRNKQAGVVTADGVVLGINKTGTPHNTEANLRSGAAYWAYTSSTHAFVVAKDYSEITAVDITNIETDLNDLVYAGVKTVNSTEISLTDVFVVKVDPAAPAAEYTLTWNSVANVSSLSVNGGLTSGAKLHKDDTITVAATVDGGYRLNITVNGTTKSITGTGTQTFTMPGADTAMKLEVVDANLVPQDTLSYVLKAGGAGSSSSPYIINVFYSGTKPSDAQVINDIAAKLGITDASKVDQTVNSSKTVKFTVANGLASTYYTIDLVDGAASNQDSGIIAAYKGTIGGNTVFVAQVDNANGATSAKVALDELAEVMDTDTHKLNSDLRTALTGTYAKANATTGLSATVTDAVDSTKKYADVDTATITAGGFDLTPGYVKVSKVTGGDYKNDGTYVAIADGLTVAAADFTAAGTGTGLIYTMGGDTKYAAYGETITLTGDVTDVTKGYVKVIVVDNTDAATDGFKVTTAKDTTGITAAGNTYAAVGDTAVKVIATNSGAVAEDSQVTITGASAGNVTTAADLDGTGKTATAGTADITITITDKP